MSDKAPLKNGRSEDDTSEYAGSLAPETQGEARRESRRGDDRVMPGGDAGTDDSVGPPELDREKVPSGAEKPDQGT